MIGPDETVDPVAMTLHATADAFLSAVALFAISSNVEPTVPVVRDFAISVLDEIIAREIAEHAART